MHIAILTFEGFNELDSLVALGVLNRVKKPDWRVTLSCPSPSVTSMNGVTLNAQSTLADACMAAHFDMCLFKPSAKTCSEPNLPFQRIQAISLHSQRFRKRDEMGCERTFGRSR